MWLGSALPLPSSLTTVHSWWFIVYCGKVCLGGAQRVIQHLSQSRHENTAAMNCSHAHTVSSTQVKSGSYQLRGERLSKAMHCGIGHIPLFGFFAPSVPVFLAAVYLSARSPLGSFTNNDSSFSLLSTPCGLFPFHSISALLGFLVVFSYVSAYGPCLLRLNLPKGHKESPSSSPGSTAT